jgi:hypothetical protein
MFFALTFVIYLLGCACIFSAVLFNFIIYGFANESRH